MWGITIMVLWTWGLTPLWVNIIASVICAIDVIAKTIKDLDI